MNNPTDFLDEDWIRNELSVLQQVPPRSAEAESRGRAKFQAEVASLRQPAQVSNQNLLSQLDQWIAMLFGKNNYRALVGALAVLLVFILIFGSGAVTVYAAQSSLPDQPLYPIKLLSEDVRLDLASNPQAKFQLDQEFINRRFAEIAQLSQNGQTPGADLTDQLQKDLNNSLDNLAQLNNSDATPRLQNLLNNLQQHQQQLAVLQANANPNAAAQYSRVVEMLQTRLDLLQQGIKNPQELHQMLSQPHGKSDQHNSATPTPAVTSTLSSNEILETSETPADDSQANCSEQNNGKGNQGNNKNKDCEPGAQSTVTNGSATETPVSPSQQKTPNNNNQNNGNNGNNGNGNKNGKGHHNK